MEGKKGFEARNVPNDWLNMPVPVWVCDIDFQDSKNNSNVNNGGNVGNHKLVVGTGYSEIRIYDVRAGEKPGTSISFQMWKIMISHRSCLFVQRQMENQFLRETRKGASCELTWALVRLYAITKALLGPLDGCRYTVQQNVLLSVSIDRMLRVHHIETGSF